MKETSSAEEDRVSGIIKLNQADDLKHFEYSRSNISTKSVIYYPENEDRLKYFILKAKSQGLKIRIVGGGTSVDTLVVNPDEEDVIVLSLKKLKLFELDEKGGFVDISAGMSIYEAMSKLRPKGWMLPNKFEDYRITIGGLVAGFGHGNRHGVGGLHENIIHLDYMDDDGEIKRCISSNDKADHIGKFGVCGVIVSVKLRMVAEFGREYTERMRFPLQSKGKLLKSFSDFFENGDTSDVFFNVENKEFLVFLRYLISDKKERIKEVLGSDRKLVEGVEDMYKNAYKAETDVKLTKVTIPNDMPKLDMAIWVDDNTSVSLKDGFPRLRDIKTKALIPTTNHFNLKRYAEVARLIKIDGIFEVLEKISDDVQLNNPIWMTQYYNTNILNGQTGNYILLVVRENYANKDRNSKNIAMDKMMLIEKILIESEGSFEHPGTCYGYGENENGVVMPFSNQYKSNIFKTVEETVTNKRKLFLAGAALKWFHTEKHVEFTDKQLEGTSCGYDDECISSCCDMGKSIPSNRKCLKKKEVGKECVKGCQCSSGDCSYSILWRKKFCY